MGQESPFTGAIGPAENLLQFIIPETPIKNTTTKGATSSIDLERAFHSILPQLFLKNLFSFLGYNQQIFVSLWRAKYR
jgi:hypothetical protein